MTDYSVLFDPIWSWPWVILAAAVTLATIVLTYPKRVAHLTPAHRWFLVSLRLFAWAVLVFAMLRPAFEFTSTDKHGALYYVVADVSRSMGVSDGPAGMTRREALLKSLEDAKPELEKFALEMKLFRYDFDKEALAVEVFRPEATGEQTAIGHVLDQFPRLAQGKRIAGVLMLSDFAQRALPQYDDDPRAAASRLAEQQVRVDTVGFGSSGLSETALDLIAEDLEVSPTVFVKNTVVVSAKVRALGAADRDLTVRLLIEDSSGKDAGQPGKMRVAAPPAKIRATRSQEVLPVEFNFVADEPGEFRLTVEVVPLEGEALTVNNQQTTYISVLKGGVSVALFDDALHPEHKFIRRIDESPDIRVDFKPIRLGQLGERVPLEPEWFEPGKYDVYIIGNVRAKVFGPDILQKLARTVEQGAGLLMIGGFRSFGPGGYADTPLANLLPVEMERTEVQNTDDIEESLHHTGSLPMIPTSLGLQHFVMRLDTPAKNRERWRLLPPLEGANKFHDTKPLALKFAESRDGIPILLGLESGRARTMAMAADTTYLWYLAGKQEEHQRFWQQVILWLAHKDVQGDESVWVRLDGRRFRAGQPVGMTMGARDAEKRPIDDAEFKVEITDPDGKKEQITPQRSGTETLGKFLNAKAPGEYKVRVEASKNGQPVGLGAESRFLVFEQDLEMHNPAADFVLMEEIARITGGAVVAPEDLANHLRKLLKQGLNVEVTEIKRVQLWDNWPLLAVFVFTLTAEWFLRKKRGLV